MTRRMLAALVVLLAVGAAAATTVVFVSRGDSGSGRRTELESTLDLSSQPAEMVALYHFVESHPALFEQIPCYCGCGPAIGHKSLFDCFVIAPGRYSDHAAGCTVCTDEATDVQRLAGDGQDTATIRQYIDAEYSKYGPPTKTK